MSTKAVLNFIDTVLQHWPPYQWDDDRQKSWVNTMVRELAGFSDAILNKAITEMIRKRTDRRIPTVAECLDACYEAKRWLDAEKTKGELPLEHQLGGSRAMEHTAERKKLADEIALDPNNPLVRQAAKEQWIGILHDFVRKHRRMPDPRQRIEYLKSVHTKKGHGEMLSEVEWCRREGRDHLEAYEACVRGGWPYAKVLLDQLGDPMRQRRNQKIDRVLHGVLP
jgi:hypothetical protein